SSSSQSRRGTSASSLDVLRRRRRPPLARPSAHATVFAKRALVAARRLTTQGAAGYKNFVAPRLNRFVEFPSATDRRNSPTGTGVHGTAHCLWPPTVRRCREWLTF